MQGDPTYYVRQSAYSEPGECVHLLRDLPSDGEGLCRLAPNVILHYFFRVALGLPESSERQDDRLARSLRGILERVAELDDHPLVEARPCEARFYGNCRDFALLTCGLLRHAGIPARLRCGFATYFTPGFLEDHWVCETWDDTEGRWRLVDAQLDPWHCERFSISFDPLDVPRDAFLTAGDAWQRARREPALGRSLGVSLLDISGPWFMAGSLLRDLAALNKVELQPWDYWSFAVDLADAGTIAEEEEVLLDDIAAVIAPGAPTLAEVRRLYERSDVAVPDTIVSFPYGQRMTVRSAPTP